MPAFVLLLWALLIVGGLDPVASAAPFLFAQGLAWVVHIKEMKQRFARLHSRRHDT